MKPFTLTAIALLFAQSLFVSARATQNSSPEPVVVSKHVAEEGTVKDESKDKPLSDVLNDRLPKWLHFAGQIRFRAEGFTGSGFKRNSDDAYAFERVRLNMKIQPTTWLKFYFQGQDAHVLGESQLAPLPPNQNSMDLRLAYVELGDIEKSPFRMRVGRQDLEFGSQRLVGSAEWINTARSFDGILGSIRQQEFRLDLFAASVIKLHDNQFDENIPGNNLYGLYLSLPHLIPQSKLEPFFFWRRQSGLLSETKRSGTSNFGTYGFHWSGKVPANWDYDFEMARQSGSLGTDDMNAWAGHWMIAHTFPRAKIKPRLVAEYNYASGDHNSIDGKRGTFDQLFPSGHDLYGLTDQVGWRNIRHVRVGAAIKPRERMTLSTKYNAYWLADPHDALYNTAGVAVAKSPTGTAGAYVGDELDLAGSYGLNRRTLFLIGIGHLFPGDFLKHATPGVGFTYPYLALSYSF